MAAFQVKGQTRGYLGWEWEGWDQRWMRSSLPRMGRRSRKLRRMQGDTGRAGRWEAILVTGMDTGTDSHKDRLVGNNRLKGKVPDMGIVMDMDKRMGRAWVVGMRQRRWRCW
jgi:hypothetical protein